MIFSSLYFLSLFFSYSFALSLSFPKFLCYSFCLSIQHDIQISPLLLLSLLSFTFFSPAIFLYCFLSIYKRRLGSFPPFISSFDWFPVSFSFHPSVVYRSLSIKVENCHLSVFKPFHFLSSSFFVLIISIHFFSHLPVSLADTCSISPPLLLLFFLYFFFLFPNISILFNGFPFLRLLPLSLPLPSLSLFHLNLPFQMPLFFSFKLLLRPTSLILSPPLALSFLFIFLFKYLFIPM